MNKYLKLLACAVVVFVGATFLHPHIAHAGAIHDQLIGVTPNYNAQDVENRCYNDGWSVVQEQWVSAINAPTSTSATVPYGSTTVPLQLNYLTYRCNGNSTIIYGSFQVTATATFFSPDVPQLDGLVGDMVYAGVGGYNTGDLRNFDFPVAPVTGPTVINIAMQTRGTITPFFQPSTCAIWGAGDYGGQTPGGDPHNFDWCATGWSVFPINVNVQAAPPVGTVDGASCSTINGWTFDPDNPNQSIYVDIWVDGVAVPFRHYPANQSRPDVNAAFGIGGNHGYSVSVPASFQDGASHGVDVWAYGINAAGAEDGVNGYLGHKTFGPCQPPPSVDIKIKGANDPAPTNSPNPIQIGGSIIVSWTSANSTECHTSGGNWGSSATNIGTSGSKDQTSDSATAGTKTYSITCTRAGAPDAIDSVQIIVLPRPTASLTVTGPDPASPTLVEVGDPVTVKWQTTDASACSSGGQWTGTPVNPIVSGSVGRAGDTGTAGIKTYTLTCTGPGGPTVPPTITATIAVVNKPYFRTYGGDVLSGGSFTDSSGSCALNGNAGILSYNKPASGYAGAGVQYLAQSYGSIYQFASAALRTSAPMPPNGLAPDNSLTWGGGFGTASCAIDYSTAKTTGTANPTLGNGYTGIGPDTHIALKASGDVFIDSDVCYGGCGSNPSWIDSTHIPSFYLIVTGNIYIRNTVKQLDGVYIAMPNGANTGKIYTCAQNGSLYSSASLYDSCSTPLTVNGAFIADQIKFLRTFGSLTNGTPGELPTAAPRNCYASGPVFSAPTCAAEVFNYGPELWLNGPGLFPSAVQPYDSITGLPPVL